MVDEFVPAAGRNVPTVAYDFLIALSARERKLRGGVISAVEASMRMIDSPRILEVGCGTGTLSIALALELQRAHVSALDIDRAALSIARTKPGAERVEWIQGRADNPPPEPESWDCVVISLVLHHLQPDQQSLALVAAHAALRPGGTLHVIDFGPPRGLLPRLGWPLLQRIDGRSNTEPLGRGDLPGMIDAAGFRERRLRARFGTVWGTHEQYSAAS